MQPWRQLCCHCHHGNHDAGNGGSVGDYGDDGNYEETNFWQSVTKYLHLFQIIRGKWELLKWKNLASECQDFDKILWCEFLPFCSEEPSKVVWVVGPADVHSKQKMFEKIENEALTRIPFCCCCGVNFPLFQGVAQLEGGRMNERGGYICCPHIWGNLIIHCNWEECWIVLSVAG